MNKLFGDMKTDEEKSAFFLSGRGYETGVIAAAIQNDVAMAYHRCAEYKKELVALRAEYDRLNRYYKNGIDCFANPCERHSGERTPPFSEFFEKYGGQCLICAVDNNKALQAECEKLRCIISDIKDWDCDVNGGFLSIPLGLRRRMQEAIDAHPQPASDVARLGKTPINVSYCDGNGAGRSRPEDCRYGVSYVTVADTVYWPLTPEETQRLRSAECGRGDFTGPGTPTNVAHLVEALRDALRERVGQLEYSNAVNADAKAQAAKHAEEVDRLRERVRELETALVRHADQIAQRIPGDLVPEEVSWPSILTAVSELKSQRNNADYRVAELEAQVRTAGAEALEKASAAFLKSAEQRAPDQWRERSTILKLACWLLQEAHRLRGEGE